MTDSKELMRGAAYALEGARAIRDEYKDKPMPADRRATLKRMLDDHDILLAEAEVKRREEYLHEPQYKHSMTGADKDWQSADVTADREMPAALRSLDGVKKLAAFAKGEAKAALVQDATGQNLVPTDFAGTILKEMPRRGVIRSQAWIVPTTSNKLDVGNVTIAAGGWGVLETGSTVADGLGATPGDKDTITVWDLNALVKVGRDELDDAPALEEVIRAALVAKFAEQEDDAFAAGTGDTNKMPFGLATRVTDGTITQGTAAAAGETLVADDVRGLQYKIPSWADDQGAAYYGHSTVAAAAALLKESGTGAYVWKDPERVGDRPTLFGRPFYRLDGLPSMLATDDVGAGTNPALIYGSLKAGYMIADRRQITVQALREKYIDEGRIGLLFTLRVGGDVARPKAFAALKL